LSFVIVIFSSAPIMSGLHTINLVFSLKP